MNRDRPWETPEEDWRAAVNRVRAGRALEPASWPGGARCALALSFDCDHETFEMGAGKSAIGRLAWGEFGRRRGVPRVLDVLARHDARATFFVPAVAGLIEPEALQPIVGAGHEIGVHGWIHENTSLLDRETERTLLLRSRDTLERLTGQTPVGHRAANWDLSAHTLELVAEAGFAYDSSLMADDACYEPVCDGRPTGLVEIPVDWVRDDAVYLLFNREPPTRPWTAPADVLDIFRREFDMAFDEGGVCQLVFHPFVIGYRSRIWILDELIRHAKARGPVWIPTHAELAEWVRKA
ncbi:polysaccharide deacetylase family protein [Jannaschia seohaensis]|uniref:Chitooligosaccharide deacetylase n=1 Tax=Jannaschia seohaensis TaxID=475081 RepID=A0A2Y9AVN6_9RHOB|nr:polysaccharide deacetylase [Jannaschia seohaensis]PWJ17057.1 polysaccharide deacetylase [Jannaschia seohaensis]SSA48394.1 Polysaccharide deacetylase [Jannaschia seohaensis]